MNISVKSISYPKGISTHYSISNPISKIERNNQLGQLQKELLTICE